VLGLIDLKGMIVAGDALHCNRKMVDAIVAKGGDYCFTLQANQDSLLSDARATLAKVKPGHPTVKGLAEHH
jgi:predicted transposase YbfD/YdcC